MFGATTARLSAASLAAALALAPLAAQAAATPPVTSAQSSARLLTDTDAYAPGRRFHAALELTVAPGWHSYWIDPGDAGAPTELHITGPGLTAGPLQWPLPQRLPDGPAVSFGYTGTVVLPLAVTAAAPGGAALAATATWLVCNQICIPEHAAFHLTLPQGTPAAAPEAAAINAALAAVPKPAPFPVHIAPDATVFADNPPPAEAASFFPLASDTTVLDAVAEVSRQNTLLLLHLKPTASFKPGQTMPGVLVLTSGGVRTGYSVTATPAPLPGARAGGLNLPLAWLLAFAGGVVLNLMPCVFPILAMKAMGIVRLSGAARGQVRAAAFAYSAGVLLSFGAIAALLLVLRAAGHEAGWGFQFQVPAFVALMAWLFFGIGLNLSGLFDIGAAFAGVGQGLAAREGLAGSFATGALAVVVATPCTAPFMGAGLAAAATLPAVASVTVFLALGLGFCAPWLLLGLAPALARFLPRPGFWMLRLREAMAFLMYGATLWLLWVLAQESGPPGVILGGLGCWLLALAVWLLRLGHKGSSRAVLPRVAAAACVLATLGLALTPALGAAGAGAQTSAADQAYTPAKLAALQAEGRPVLVNMTAAWCVTCLVNERVAIDPALPRLRAAGVAYLTGDWTSRDPDITDFLHRFGRVGVPLYVYFPPHGAPQVLPQILTPQLLRSLG